MPLEQTSPTWQALPHAPQLFTSLAVFTQFRLQLVWPEGHVQLPPVQVCAGPQVVPQLPQFVLLVAVSTHTPLHAVCVGGQGMHCCVWLLQVPLQQTPLQQIRFAGHAVPHAPQFALSVLVSTQVPLQFVWPVGQHLPLEHV